MERVKPFTERDVRSNKYTIVNNRLIITYTKTFDDYVNEINSVIYRYLTTKDAKISDFI